MFQVLSFRQGATMPGKGAEQCPIFQLRLMMADLRTLNRRAMGDLRY